LDSARARFLLLAISKGFLKRSQGYILHEGF
jgi:hypothetical protein